MSDESTTVRQHGDNILAQCDMPHCDRIMPRDFLHCCQSCGGWFCDGHLLLSDAGLLCEPCYEAARPEIEEKIRRAHDNT